MSIQGIEVDEELLSGFLDESLDHLSEVDSILASIEHADDPLESVNAIFRPVHSIKGNAPFFGFTGTRNLAHELESLLSLVRDGTRAVDKNLISVLLEGVDELRSMLERGRSKEPEILDAAALDSLIARVVQQQNEGGSAEESWRDVFSIVSSLQELAAGKPEAQSLESLLKHLRALSGGVDATEDEGAPDLSAAPEEYVRIRSLLDTPDAEQKVEEIVEQLPIALRELAAKAQSPQTKQAFEKVLDGLESYLGSIGFDPLLQEMIGGALQTFEQEMRGEEVAIEEQEAPSAEASGQEEKKEEHKKESGKSMRVAEEHIDTFLSYVGELLIVGEMLVYLERRLQPIPGTSEVNAEFTRVLEIFTNLSNALQTSLMSIRKVKVRTALQKVPRLVRDIAKDHGKDIQVVTHGDDIEVDKSLIEMLDAPLTHMVRNAADHGIEKPEERAGKGKEATGTIEVNVSENEKFIVVEVKDDGAGLNYEKIQEKAESLGLVRPGKRLTDDQIVDFLFAAGVSTAEKVTDVSGRGVGMDVVKRNIEGSGGSIKVFSERDKGSRFVVELGKSVTTHIVEGLVFQVGEQFFVVPIDQVNETFSSEPSEIFGATGEDRYIYRQEKALPVIPVFELLDTNADERTAAPRIVVSVQSQRRTYALLVDAVIGVQQIVVKSVNHLSLEKELYNGGALIGDGRIALVLDLDIFCDGYDLTGLAERSTVVTKDEGISDYDDERELERESLLLAHIDGGKRVGIPLGTVDRLEKVQEHQIERASGKPAIQYRDTILPVVCAASELSDEDGELDLVICHTANEPVGILVDEILDIVEDDIFVDEVGAFPGVRGTSVVLDKVTDILEVERFVEVRR